MNQSILDKLYKMGRDLKQDVINAKTLHEDAEAAVSRTKAALDGRKKELEDFQAALAAIEKLP